MEEDLSGYLARVGKQEVFERLRYAALDQPAVAFSDVPLSQVYFELLAVIRDYEKLGLRQSHFPSRRIDRRVEDAVSRAMESDTEEFERREAAWTWLCKLQKTEDLAWRDLLHRAHQRDFRLEGAKNDRVELLLRKALETLTSRDENSGVNFDPALYYYLRRIEYSPKGVEQQRGTPEPVLTDSSEDAVATRVLSPSGEALGMIAKKRDGAWIAEPLNAQGSAFEEKDDAALYVVRAQTRILRLNLGQHQYRDVRIVHDDDLLPWPTVAVGDSWGIPAGPYEATLCFWDNCPLDLGGTLDAALLPFDDQRESILRIEADLVSRTERTCLIRGNWVVDVRRSTDY